jgi:hypothetical protein
MADFVNVIWGGEDGQGTRRGGDSRTGGRRDRLASGREDRHEGLCTIPRCVIFTTIYTTDPTAISADSWQS